MCIIIYRPADKSLPKETLKNCFHTNEDGWGLMYVTDGKLITMRGLGGFEEFYTAYREVPRGVNLGVHFRYRTHGDISLENCHPYSVLETDLHGRDMALMHNGTIKAASDQAKRSDTWHYIRDSLRPILSAEPQLMYNETIQGMIGDEIGWSRLLVMDSEGNSAIVNQDSGDWKYGCWFSNDGYLPPRTYYKPYRHFSQYKAEEYDEGGYYIGDYSAPNNLTTTGRTITTSGQLANDWEAELDRREAAAGMTCTSAAAIGDDDDYEISDDPDYMTETELFNWVCENPEQATDYIMQLGGGSLAH